MGKNESSDSRFRKKRKHRNFDIEALYDKKDETCESKHKYKKSNDKSSKKDKHCNKCKKRKRCKKCDKKFDKCKCKHFRGCECKKQHNPEENVNVTSQSLQDLNILLYLAFYYHILLFYKYLDFLYFLIFELH